MINTDDTTTPPTYRRPDSQPQSYVTFDLARPVLRHKMYKAGKFWVTAGVVGLATTVGSVMVMGTAHADTTTGTTAATTTANAGSTSAYTQVNVDSSGVQKAAASASAAGVKVTQTQGTTYNAQGSAQLNSATSAVASHYAAETSTLASATTQAQNSTAVSEAVSAMNSATSAAVASAIAARVRVSTTPTSTVKVGTNGESVAQAQADVASAQAQASAAIAKLNTATSDNIATKTAVASGNAQIASDATSASSTPGLTVTKASSSVSVSSVDEAKSAAASQVALLIQATSTQAANNAAVAAANKQPSDAASTAKAAGVAVKAGETKVYSSVVEAQKAASSEAAVIADRASTATKSDNGGTINTSDIIQQLQIGNEDHATLTVSDVKGATVNKATKLFWGDLSTYAYTFVPSEKQGTITVTATYTGLTKSSYTDANGVTHQISKIVRTFKWDGSTSAAQTTGTVDGVKGVTFFINNQPQEGFGYYGGTVTETDQFYDQNGNLITIGPNAYISVSSLNSSTNGNSVTTGSVLGGGWSVKNGRVEGAKGVDNVVLKPIQGSSVRLDSKTGWLNAPEGNDSICVGFGDKTGKYSYVGNGGKTLYNLTLNESGNWVVGDAILQGTGENGTVTSTDIWNAGYAWWDGSNGAAGNTQYFGAAAGEIDPGSTSITVAFYTNGELLDSGNYWGTWAMVSTTIPSSPTTTYNPVAVAGTSVSYPTLTWIPHYTPSDYAVNKYESGYTPVSATVSYDTINYSPETQKNVTETKGGKATSVDGNQVVKGDTMQYTVTTSDLPANRTASVNNVTFTDTLPDGFKMTSAKIFNQKGEDITSEFIFTQDGQKITFNGSNTKMLMAMNLNKSEAYKMPYLVITGTVTADGADLVNKAFVNVNDTNIGSNTVETHTPNYDPTKSETANGGSEDANGKILQLGDTINYKVTADYSEVNSKTNVSDTAKTKGLSICDTYDAETTPVQSSLKITDAAGKTVPASAYSVKWDTVNHRVTVTWTNVDAFLVTYGGQKLALTFDDKINSDTKAAYTIKNTAYQVNFGETYPTNTVTNTVIKSNPTKSETVDNSGTDGNGKLVVAGDTINYKITWDLCGVTDKNTSATQQAADWALVDTYDAKTTADQSSVTITDASGKTLPADAYKVSFDTTKQVMTITPTNVKDFLAKYGNQVLTVAFNAVVNDNLKDGDVISNTAYQVNAGHKYTTETVTNKVTVPNPTKDVVISVDNTKSMNDSEISLGEEFDYELNGGVIPQNYGGKLSEYGFKDDYDQELDQYNGQFTVLADQDIHLTDGTVITKGTSLNQYVTQSIDQENGEVTLEFNKSFLDRIDFSKGGFSASAYLAMKRIKAGTVYNVFTNTVNGKDYKSNTVKTTTPEPKTPETPATPTPQKLTPSNPTTPATPTTLVATPAPAAATPTPAATPSQQTLPQTGAAEEAGLVGLGLAGFLMSLGVLGASKKRKQA